MTHHPPSLTPFTIRVYHVNYLLLWRRWGGGWGGVAHTLDTSLPPVMNHYYYLINPFTLNEWLASSFSLLYHCWNQHCDDENIGNDLQEMFLISLPAPEKCIKNSMENVDIHVRLQRIKVAWIFLLKWAGPLLFSFHLLAIRNSPY